MRKLNPALARFPSLGLPALPGQVRTRDGQAVRPADDVWIFRKRADGGGKLRLNWLTLRGLTPRMIFLSKLILAGRISGFAPISVRNDFETLRRLAQWYPSITGSNPLDLDWSLINLGLAERWLEHGMSTGNRGNDFARLRDLYRYGAVALQHEDFSMETLLALETVRAAGNLKGNAVRAGDPQAGHLTPPELEFVLAALGEERGETTHRATVWLSLETGRNSMQYSLLTNRDLLRASVADGGQPEYLYQVRFRRIKKRTVQDETMTLPISTELGDLLWSLRRGAAEDRLLWWLGEGNPEGAISRLMGHWAAAAALVSPRTGQTLNLNARRFRVTMLTNAADEGASAEHLAMLADHSDLQNIQVYLDRSPLFLLRIRDKVDAIYDPMVRRFQGSFTTESAAARKHLPIIPGFAPQLPLLNVGGIGACGRSDLCRLAPPLTCYTCPHFIAFRDGPHEEVAAALEVSMTGMNERVGLQVANALAAVREVVARVEADPPPVEDA